MARPPKKEIDYSGWSVRIFDNEPKFDKLLDAQGWDGFGVYFFLCQRAYGSEGYFYRWGYADCATTARKMGGGIGSGTVRETVDYCLQIGLFDKGLFDRWGILTSRGIQSRYWEVAKERDVKEVISEYWLLQEEKCKGLLTIPLNTYLSNGNTDSETGNTSFLLGNDGFQPQKERKVKDSKEKKKSDVQSALALFESLWKLYPCKKGKGQVSETKKLNLLKYGFDEMSRTIERYLSELEKDKDWRKPQNGSTFFNSGYVDYLDCNFMGEEKEKKAESVELEDRFSVLESGLRTKLEDAGVIDGQSLVYGNATDEQIKILQKVGII